MKPIPDPEFDSHYDEHEPVTQDHLLKLANCSVKPNAAEIARRSLLEAEPDEISDEMGDALRRQAYAMNDFYHGVFFEVGEMLARVGIGNDGMRTFQTAALGMGWTDVANATTPAELAGNYGKPRETVNKPLLEFMEKVKLPPLPSQRDKESVENITQGRNENKVTAGKSFKKQIEKLSKL